MTAVVGRDERIAWGRAQLVAGRGVAVCGAAGMGKTVLARSLVGSHDPSSVVWLSVTRSAATIAFGPVAPLLGELGLAAAQPHHVLAAIASTLTERRPGAVVVVDDAHLADEASAAVIHRLASDHVPVVVTARSDEPCPDAIVALWADGLVERVDLAPLDVAGVTAQVEEMLEGPVAEETARRIHALTGGNPLFVREVVLTGRGDGWLQVEAGHWRAAGGPPSSGARLRELIASRLLDCPPSLLEVLELVAVAEQVELVALRALVDLDAVVRLEDRQLLRVVDAASGPVVTIDHPIIGEVVRADLGDLRRARHAERLVEAMEDLAPHTTDRLLRLGELAMESSEPRPDLLVEASRAASAVHDFRAAARLARSAAEHGGGVAAELAWASAAVAARDFGVAERVARRTLELDGTTSAERARATVTLATVLLYGLGRAEEAEAVLTEALASVDSVEERQFLDSELALVLLNRGRVDQVLDRSLPLMSTDVSVAVRLRAAGNAASAYALKGWIEDVERIADAYLALADAHELVAPRVGVELLAAQLFGRCLSGGAVATVSEAEGFLDLARRSSDVELEGVVSLLLGLGYLGCGRIPDAASHLDRALELFVDHDTAQLAAWAHALRAHAAAIVGDLPAVDAHLERSVAPPFHALTGYDFDRTMARVRAAVHRGDRRGAIGLALERAAEMAEHGRDAAEASLLDVAARCGHGPAAERLAELAARAQGPLVPAMGEHAAALVAGDAERLLEVAARLEDIGDWFAAADAAAAASRLAWEAGRKATASACAERATELLARGGIPNPTLPLPVPDLMLELTGRELEVALLAARGRTNRQIADELWLSPRTVGNHLYRAYAKAGVDGREALAEVLRAAGHLR